MLFLCLLAISMGNPGTSQKSLVVTMKMANQHLGRSQKDFFLIFIVVDFLNNIMIFVNLNFSYYAHLLYFCFWIKSKHF